MYNFQLSQEESDLRFPAVARGGRSTILGQVSLVRKLIVPCKIGSQRESQAKYAVPVGCERLVSSSWSKGESRSGTCEGAT